MPKVQIVVAIVMSAQIISCSPDAGREDNHHSCKYMAEGYKRLRVELDALPELDVKRIPSNVLEDIRRCSSRFPYSSREHSLALRDARVASDDSYYIVFKAKGITDVLIAFRVNKMGAVKGAYQSGRM